VSVYRHAGAEIRVDGVPFEGIIAVEYSETKSERAPLRGLTARAFRASFSTTITEEAYARIRRLIHECPSGNVQGAACWACACERMTYAEACAIAEREGRRERLAARKAAIVEARAKRQRTEVERFLEEHRERRLDALLTDDTCLALARGEWRRA
jgi:hypothetical protein